MSARYAAASEIFLAACELPLAERAAYLDSSCRGDPALRAEVEELLSFDVDPAAIEPDAPPHEPLEPGALFAGRYRVVAQLGRGSMGVVYRAVDERLAQTVALKVLRTSSPARREQLAREVRLARQVTHPAVCRVYDFEEAGHECFLSMELVDGENLATLLLRVGRLAPDRVLAIAREVLDGLAEAHASGVLHRDLKPANLLMDAGGHVCITDFGIATGGDPADALALPAGTPAYMAPEQRSGGALSAQTDLYALGVLLYELCTGARPGNPPEPPSRRVPDVDPQLERAILSALEPDPTRRPSSARVMLGMLQKPEPAPAPERPPDRAAPPEQRRITVMFVDAQRLERVRARAVARGAPGDPLRRARCGPQGARAPRRPRGAAARPRAAGVIRLSGGARRRADSRRDRRARDPGGDPAARARMAVAAGGAVRGADRHPYRPRDRGGAGRRDRRLRVRPHGRRGDRAGPVRERRSGARERRSAQPRRLVRGLGSERHRARSRHRGPAPRVRGLEPAGGGRAGRPGRAVRRARARDRAAARALPQSLRGRGSARAGARRERHRQVAPARGGARADRRRAPPLAAGPVHAVHDEHAALPVQPESRAVSRHRTRSPRVRAPRAPAQRVRGARDRAAGSAAAARAIARGPRPRRASASIPRRSATPPMPRSSRSPSARQRPSRSCSWSRICTGPTPPRWKCCSSPTRYAQRCARC